MDSLKDVMALMDAVVWQLWAEYVSLDRSNDMRWPSSLRPSHLTHLLRPNAAQHLSNATQSAHMALACVDASLVDLKRLREECEAFGRLLDGNMRQLEVPT